MRLLVLLFFALLILPEEKVSVKCARERAICDSVMRVEYGDSIFRKWFEFDTASYVWADDNQMCKWNETFIGDTISYYNFRYRFRFPGSKISPIDTWHVDIQPRSFATPAVSPAAFANYKGPFVTQSKMEALTKKHLRKNLADCHTILWEFDWYGDDLIPLDTTHAYIEVHDYTREGSTERGKKFKVQDYTILIDAFTGKYIGRDKFILEGINGSF